MIKNRCFSQFHEDELRIGYKSMVDELSVLDPLDPLNYLFVKAWRSFERNEWTYDGATFVNERYNNTIFEVAAFIHDYRNSYGYVSYKIDKELLDIMILLNYPFKNILSRYLFTRLTFLNILLHKYKKNYKHNLPDDLICLRE